MLLLNVLLSLLLAGPAASAHNASPELVHELLGNDMPGFLIKPTQGEVVHDANLFWDGDAYRLVTPSRKTLLLDPSGAYLRLMVSPEHQWTLVFFRWEFPDTNELVEMTVRPDEALEVYNQELFDGLFKAAPRIQFHIMEKGTRKLLAHGGFFSEDQDEGEYLMALEHFRESEFAFYTLSDQQRADCEALIKGARIEVWK